MKKLILLLSVLVLAFGCNRKEDAAKISPQNATATDLSLEYVQKNGKLVMGFDDSFPPMGFKMDGEYMGFDIDLAREVTKRLNIELVLQPISWDAKDQELATKKIDCIWNGFTMTPEREQNLTFTKPYMANKQVIIVLDNSPIKSLAGLKGKTLALQKDSSAMNALNKFEELKKSLKQVLEFDDNLMAMTDLNAKSNDAVLMDSVVANYNYIAKFPGKYRLLSETLAEENFGIGFRKGDVALKDAVEKALTDMIADNTTVKISTKWFGSDVVTLNK